METDGGYRPSLRLSGGEQLALMVLLNIMAGSVAAYLALAWWASMDTWLGFSAQFIQSRAPWFWTLPLIWALLMFNLYDRHKARNWKNLIADILVGAALGFAAYLVLYFNLEAGSLPRRSILYFLLLVIPLTMMLQLLYHQVVSVRVLQRRVLVVGAGEAGDVVMRAINAFDPPPLEVVGLVDDDPAKRGMLFHERTVLGDSTDLLQLIAEHGITDIVVAIMGSMQGGMFQALLDAQQRNVEIIRMPVLYEQLLGRVPIHHLESDWLLRSFVDEFGSSGFYLLFKRLLDITASLIGMVLMAALLPFLAAAILIDSGWPIFFSQTRMGLGGRHYELWKLRTMRQDAEADGRAHWAQQDDPRVTRVGRWLRRMHLDEFPQFINILRGEMSLVGPRPERPELVAELEKHIPFYRARLLVKPGATGWAQVRYSKGASIEGSDEKLEYDLYYIKHRSILMDAWIVLQTFGSVFGLKGE